MSLSLPVDKTSAFSQKTVVADSPDSEGSSPVTLPSIIPPVHRSRTLILCFDGTGDQFDEDNSNVVSLCSMLKKDDSDQQMVYYQAGIGTYTSNHFFAPLSRWVTKMLDMAVAWNLDSHVKGGYEFLMENYKAGDRICIFGFSRGAYTARGLAGMINKVGLLAPSNYQQVPFAYKMFKRTDEIGWKQSDAFKKAFSVEVEIHFLGVWDTVSSVGIIPRRLPYTTNNPIVKTFRHAMSLDERRAKFEVNYWIPPERQEDNNSSKNSQPQIKSLNNETTPLLAHDENAAERGEQLEGSSNNRRNDASGKRNSRQPVRNARRRAMEKRYSSQPSHQIDVEEVWFAGCHCDVGGGSVINGTRNTLARLPLRWMVRECFKAKTGIMFIADTLYEIGLDPATLYPNVLPRPPRLSGTDTTIEPVPKSTPDLLTMEDIIEVDKTEEEEELSDALSPAYDQLSLKWSWWLLEFIPFKQRWLKKDFSWTTSLRLNLGRGRCIPRQRTDVTKVHRSVQIRTESRYKNCKEYCPKASFELASSLGHLEWVD